jgi:hypothetical protein
MYFSPVLMTLFDVKVKPDASTYGCNQIAVRECKK